MDQKQWMKSFPEPPENFHRKVEATLASLPQEKEKNIMRMKKRFAISVVTLVAVVALGTGLMATGKISSIVGTSGSAPTYTEVPTALQLSEDLDYTPSIPDSFENGYTFENGTIGTQSGLDENGNTLDKHKNFDCLYKNGDDEVSLDVAKWNTSPEEDGTVVETYNGVDLIYSANTYKNVPDDYELTEQDKADQTSGKYVFSFGCTDQVEITKMQFLTWIQDGITYSLSANDSMLTQADFTAMAKEIINQ